MKGIPETSSILMPRLVCNEPAAEMEFCVRVLDARVLNERPGSDGKVAHALMTIGPAMLMVEAEWPTLTSRAPHADGSSPVVLFLYVADVDRTVERAVAHGARVLLPAQDQFWGDRIAWIIDPSGHVWTIATRIEDTTAEERTARWSAILGQKGTA